MALDAIEAPEEIEMPPGAAEFAVGHRFEPELFLLPDQPLDLTVFDRLELGGADLAFGAPGARLLERFRPQQAADVIGAERWLGSLHDVPPNAATSSLRAGPDLVLLAGVLHPLDPADLLLPQPAVGTHHDFGEILVHDDVAGDGIDGDRPARAVEGPALERTQRLLRVDLALERLHHVHDRGHAVVTADRGEVRDRV